ncbi:hypothetical protein [Novacetimonas pomaceti]|uniref:Uncharacterized protein n=1 Tax=Novacetimonas pomaceti TaxID=2021998 RepID=A0A318QLQ7_9PROT|nr:hypothetical protein [Novacetimonas pomaceti]PYD76169.1 hypothetical protein CFR71_04715 [Novacetimonas pomaceti]
MNVSNTDTTQTGQEASASAHEGTIDPADRLEQALTRIAFAIECREQGTWPSLPPSPSSTPEVDLQALAANIDVLIARVRDLLDDGEPAAVIADVRDE